MSLSIFPMGRLAVATGLAAVLLLAANIPSPSAGVMSARMTGAPAATLGPVLPAQAPSAATPAPNVEANLAQLHQKLQITPAQEPLFARFANVMRANARMTPAAPPANPSAVDDLRTAIQVSTQELGALQRLLPSLEALYSALSPAQRQIADTVFGRGPAE
jgi:protein CpxP